MYSSEKKTLKLLSIYSNSRVFQYSTENLRVVVEASKSVKGIKGMKTHHRVANHVEG